MSSNIIKMTTTITENAEYKIMHSNKYMYVRRTSQDEPLSLSDNAESSGVVFKFLHVDNDVYYIKNKRNNKYIHFKKAESDVGDDIFQHDSTSSGSEFIVKKVNGLYTFQNVRGKLYMNHSDGGLKQGLLSNDSYWSLLSDDDDPNPNLEPYFVRKDVTDYTNYNTTPSLIGAPSKKVGDIQRTNHITKSIHVRTGEIFDGRGDVFYSCKSDGASCVLGNGNQDEDQGKVFILHDGATLRNVVVKYRFADGINVWGDKYGNDKDGSCIIENITFDNALFEDSINADSSWRGDLIIRGCKWLGKNVPYDKLCQINSNTNAKMRFIDVLTDVDDSNKLVRCNYDTILYMKNVSILNKGTIDITNDRNPTLTLYTDEKTYVEIAPQLRYSQLKTIKNTNPYDTFNFSNFHNDVKKFYDGGQNGKPAPIPSELNKLTQFQKGNYDDIYNLPLKPTYNFAAFEEQPTKEEDYHIMVQCHRVGGKGDSNKGPDFNKPVRGHIIDYAVKDGYVNVTNDELKSLVTSRIITRTVDYTVKNLMTNCTLGGFDYKICSANIVPDESNGWNNLNLDTWDKRLPKIIDNVKDYDLICCQEMNQGQLNTMMDSTSFNDFGVVSASKSSDASMIFYNKNKFNLVDYYSPLPDNQDTGRRFIDDLWKNGFFRREEYDHLVWEKENILYHTKNFCLGVFQEKTTGRVLLCVSTHFSGSGDFTEYKNTLKMVYDKYYQKYSDYDPVIVFGADTNKHTGWANSWLKEFNTYVFKPFGADLLYDGGSYEQVDKIYGNGTTSNASRGPSGLSDHYFMKVTVHI